MRAAQFSQFGPPDSVVTVADLPEPQIKPGHLLVRMLAAPINPSDVMSIRGTYGTRPNLPAVPGFEGVGIVHKAAGGIGRFLVGKRCTVLAGEGGTWAEFALISAKQAIPIPRSLSDEQAAMFFVNPATALLLTDSVLTPQPGDWFLQTASGSAVGRIVIRLARSRGFRTINVVRRPEQAEQLRKLGGDAVIVFDANRQSPDELRDAVHEITAGKGVPFAIDPVGGKTASAVVGCLGGRGKMVVYGTLTEEPLNFSPRTLMTRGASIQGFWLGPFMQRLSLLKKLSLIRRLRKLALDGTLETEVAQSYDLSRVAEALRHAEQSARGGKILLRVAPSGTST